MLQLDHQRQLASSSSSTLSYSAVVVATHKTKTCPLPTTTGTFSSRRAPVKRPQHLGRVTRGLTHQHEPQLRGFEGLRAAFVRTFLSPRCPRRQRSQTQRPHDCGTCRTTTAHQSSFVRVLIRCGDDIQVKQHHTQTKEMLPGHDNCCMSAQM